MKVLLLTPYIPYPLSEGGKVSQYAIIDHLRKLADVKLVVAVYSHEDEENANILQQHWPDVAITKIQMLEKVEKSGFRKRIKIFIKNFISSLSGNQNSLAKENVTNIIAYDTDNPYLINLFPVKKRKFIEELSVVVSEEKPDIIQVDFLEYIDVVLALPAHIKKIFVHHEIRFARLLSFFSEGKHGMACYDNYIIEKIKKEELIFLNLYDGIFVFSEEDKKKLIAEGFNKKIYAAPFPVLNKYFLPVTKENTDITKLVFVGGENHAPNKDAVEWYIHDIAKEINRVKKVALHIIGNWSEDTKNRYQDNGDIQFAGYVENLVEHCKHSAMLVPVRMGSGIRTKILYAMAQGIPVISTSIGCEGIGLKNNESILIAERPADFATAFKTILKDDAFTLNLIHSAQAIAQNYYSQESAVSLRVKYLEEVLNN